MDRTLQAKAAELAWQRAVQAADTLRAQYTQTPLRAWPLLPAVALLTALWTVGVVEIVQRLG